MHAPDQPSSEAGNISDRSFTLVNTVSAEQEPATTTRLPNDGFRNGGGSPHERDEQEHAGGRLVSSMDALPHCAAAGCVICAAISTWKAKHIWML
ncbi:hypothetical protein GUJ93_ZPchr0005g16185 [Zizania palustris]|uniref:Uncharacterized protein n=1 Tax=Zizania palustris TaxID=103762 RepID=A0A8J5STM0_ZIZPA|nr:hypothetical protein GUJ93_ZPchr0005g16185 [Zizania palustris]